MHAWFSFLLSVPLAQDAGLKCGVYPHQVLAASSSTLSNAVASYHPVNSLYDGTINCRHWLSPARRLTKHSITKKLYNKLITTTCESYGS
jgi:hypothetical protein